MALLSRPSEDMEQFAVRMRMIKTSRSTLAQHLTVFEQIHRVLGTAIAERTGTNLERDLYPQLLASVATVAIKTVLNMWIDGDGTHGLDTERLEDTRVPVHVVATAVATGRAVTLSNGPALDALLASSSMPGIYPSVRIGRRLLTDGGIAADIPVRQAETLGATVSYVLPAAMHQDPHITGVRDHPRGPDRPAEYGGSDVAATAAAPPIQFWWPGHRSRPIAARPSCVP
jgi:predicted acylesterase/phospholipase RssA